MEKLKQEGITPVADEEIGVDANDATTQVLRIRQANADAVLLIVYPKATAVFMRDAHKVGYKPICGPDRAQRSAGAAAASGHRGCPR
jgi:branched-chain amino acid transport system substrate-binding protein